MKVVTASFGAPLPCALDGRAGNDGCNRHDRLLASRDRRPRSHCETHRDTRAASERRLASVRRTGWTG